MPRSTHRLATARHVAVMVVLMLATLAAFALDDRAARRGLALDAELALTLEAGRALEASLQDESADAGARLTRWRAFAAHARGILAGHDVAAAERALARAERAMNRRRAAAAAPEAEPARAALEDVEVALRRHVAAERGHRLARRRGFAVVLVALLAAEAAWLLVPALRRRVRADADADAAREQLTFLAHHDELTGLANRRALEEHLGDLTADGAVFGVVLCDLDGFKPINDVYGHDAGDTVLDAVARRLEHGLRTGDLAARLGGDEFVVVVSEARDAATLAAIAERVRHRLADPVRYGDHQLRFSASLGTALHPADGTTPHALLGAADAAMYEAKQAGGMGVRAYTTQLRERDEMRQEIVRELETALDHDGLTLVFQPQIELASGRHVGFEALTRWPSRTRGDVPPSVFIPIAEQAGLLPPLTRWLLSEIERLTLAWRGAGLEPVRIGINVSGAALVRDDVVDAILAAAGGEGLAAGRLGIEITEDAMFGRNAEAVLERLRLLRARGTAIAIDDFGTGYASLSHLGRIPFDRLKIAGGFIDQLDRNANAAAVVRTIIELAQRLGGRTVATCVESDEQMRFLRRHRCDEAQGYGVERPLCAREAERYLIRERGLRAVR